MSASRDPTVCKLSRRAVRSLASLSKLLHSRLRRTPLVRTSVTSISIEALGLVAPAGAVLRTNTFSQASMIGLRGLMVNQARTRRAVARSKRGPIRSPCLLYTSDAADDLLCVDL